MEASPLGPTRATMVPSVTVAPRSTSVSPSWSSVTERPSAV